MLWLILVSKVYGTLFLSLFSCVLIDSFLYIYREVIRFCFSSTHFPGLTNATEVLRIS